MSIQLSTLDSRLETLMGDSEDVYADDRTAAINNAGRELYPVLYRRLVDETLITGNILPPFIWTSTSTLSLYAKSANATLTKTTTAGLFKNGNTSAKVAASAADQYLYLSSDSYPRLLDVMNNQIDFKGWVEPSTANDAFLTVAYEDANATETTSSSTTSCPASVMTLLEKEDYSIPDDITKVELRMRVHTSGQDAYFDPPRVIGTSVYELMLPQYLQDGHVSQVWLQTSGYSDDACDDLHPRFDEEVFGWNIVDDGSYKYLRLPYLLGSPRKLRLIGECPLEDDLSADADPMSIDAEKANLLLYQAAALIMQTKMGVVGRDDTSRYERQFLFYTARVEQLKPRMRMSRPSGQIRWT